MRKLISVPITGTGLRAFIGTENIAAITFASTTTMFIYLTHGAAQKITITFTTADAAFGVHATVMQAFRDALAVGSNGQYIYEMPALVGNSIVSVAYA
jgi:hypothetical protein